MSLKRPFFLTTRTSESFWGSPTSWFSLPCSSDAPFRNHLSASIREKLIIYLLLQLLSEWHATHASPHSSSLSAAGRAKLRSCSGSLGLPSPGPRDCEASGHLSPTEPPVPWSLCRPPPRAAGVGASPAPRFQLRLPECGTCSKRWRGSASAAAAGPEPLCLLPPLPAPPPLALQLQPRPLNERRKPARSGCRGAPAPGAHLVSTARFSFF